jgi:hypothetical protein
MLYIYLGVDVRGENTHLYGGLKHKIDVGENQRGNQEWTIQRHWQHWTHMTQNIFKSQGIQYRPNTRRSSWS